MMHGQLGEALAYGVCATCSTSPSWYNQEQMAPHDSSTRLEVEYSQPEDCPMILFGPRSSLGNPKIKCSSSKETFRGTL